MSLEAALLVGAGGSIGAVLRYYVGRWIDGERFPVPTLVVNVLGSFVAGLVLFGGAGEGAVLFVAVGVCGAFTTYSSFSFQTVRLWERGDRMLAGVNAVGNLGGCLAALWLAFVLVSLASP